MLTHFQTDRANYLLAVISGICVAHQVVIGPAVQVRVLSANEAVSGVARPTLALVHGIVEVADVDAFGIFVAAVGLVLAGILGLTHLKGKRQLEEDYGVCHTLTASNSQQSLDAICPKRKLELRASR